MLIQVIESTFFIEIFEFVPFAVKLILVKILVDNKP